MSSLARYFAANATSDIPGQGLPHMVGDLPTDDLTMEHIKNEPSYTPTQPESEHT